MLSNIRIYPINSEKLHSWFPFIDKLLTMTATKYYFSPVALQDRSIHMGGFECKNTVLDVNLRLVLREMVVCAALLLKKSVSNIVAPVRVAKTFAICLH